MNNKMNREIKFRGKEMHNDLGWVYGSLIQYPNGACVIVTFDKDGKELSYDVDPKTVGEYIGLKDRNGIEVYSGDIVEYTYMCKEVEKPRREVIFKYGAFCLRVKNGPSARINGKYRFFESSWEVIGNIHDNSELIECK